MNDMFSQLSDAMANAVKTASASLVRVDARRRMSASGVVWSADGLIVTANHVVERDDKIQIGLPNGTTVAATVVGRDPRVDVAILKAEATDLTVPNWADTASLQVGQLVLAVGRPSMQPTATLGVISTLSDEVWRNRMGGSFDRYVQPDVVMYPGFSGGPLVTADGKIAGINTSALTEGSALTIPAATLIRTAEMLMKHGKVRQGYLGVGSQPVRLPEALMQSAGQEIGLMLVSVEAGSPAEQGGMTLGDVMLKADGQALDSMDALYSYLGGERVGQTGQFQIARGGQLQMVAVTVGER